MHGNTKFSGVYPMAYTFFDKNDTVDLEALKIQIETLIQWGASGISVLGLAGEGHKLTTAERHRIVECAGETIAGRVALAVTVAGCSVHEQIGFGRAAGRAGADWLILQPAQVRDVGEAEHMRFFGAVADGVDLPVGVQIAPDYLGQGFAPESLVRLKARHDNVRLMKTEMSAIGVADFIHRTEGAFDVFNGQAGIGMIDCIQAGCKGFIPGAETADISSQIHRLYVSGTAGNKRRAIALYQEVLPLWHTIMESIDIFLIYGKPLMAQRNSGLNGRVRRPHGTTTPFGRARVAEWARMMTGDDR